MAQDNGTQNKVGHVRDSARRKSCCLSVSSKMVYCCNNPTVTGSGKRKGSVQEIVVYSTHMREPGTAPAARDYNDDDHDDLYTQVKMMNYTVSTQTISPLHESGQQYRRTRRKRMGMGGS